MNKSDLIEALAKKEELKDKEAVEIVNMVFKGFTKTLKEGPSWTIQQFYLT